MRFLSFHDDIVKMLRGKRICGHRTLKPRSKFILKNLFFVQFKTKWSITYVIIVFVYALVKLCEIVVF